MTNPTDELSIDAILQALADPQRRIVLRELADESASVLPVQALEQAVSRGLEHSSPESPSRTAVEIQLRHVHLPRLDDAGLCAYDPDEQFVEYCGDEFAESLLEFLEDRTPSRRVY